MSTLASTRSKMVFSGWQFLSLILNVQSFNSYLSGDHFVCLLENGCIFYCHRFSTTFPTRFYLLCVIIIIGLPFFHLNVIFHLFCRHLATIVYSNVLYDFLVFTGFFPQLLLIMLVCPLNRGSACIICCQNDNFSTSRMILCIFRLFLSIRIRV